MIERFYKISGNEAENIVGRKLDKRISYYLMKDEYQSDEDKAVALWSVSRWVQICSGCSEYEMGTPIYEGCGCAECGYTGKRRQAMYTPHVWKNGITMEDLTDDK